jgi:hypothetical protein
LIKAAKKEMLQAPLDAAETPSNPVQELNDSYHVFQET